LKVETEYN